MEIMKCSQNEVLSPNDEPGRCVDSNVKDGLNLNLSNFLFIVDYYRLKVRYQSYVFTKYYKDLIKY